MAAPGVRTIEAERAVVQRRPGDVSTAVMAGAALRGPVDRVVEVRDTDELDLFVGAAFGASHLRRSADMFFADGGSRLLISRAVDATAVAATANVVDGSTGVVLVATADGPGAWGNAVKLTVASGSAADRKMITVEDGGIVRVAVEVGSTAEAIARVEKPGVLKLAAGAAAWPPANGTITLSGGVAADESVTAANVVTAIERIPASAGPCSLLAPGHTTQTVHEALMRLARARGWHYLLDLPDINTTATLLSSAAALRALDDQKPGRYGRALWPWVKVSIGPWVSVPVPPSAGQAARDARADNEDHQGVARIAAGIDYVSRAAIDVTQTPTDADWDRLHDAGITVIRKEPEGICAMGSRTLVDSARWPQYAFAAGARVRMSIVDEARGVVRRRLFSPLDSEGLTIERIIADITNVCQPWAANGGLYAENGDNGYSVRVVSSGEDLRQGRVRVRLGLRTAPTVEMVVIEFTSVALGDQL